MNRTFYFLRDSVTGKFYDGENCDQLVQFDKAAVYHQRKNAESRMNRMINIKYCGSWLWYENCLKDPKYLYYIEDLERTEHINEITNLINERKDLPNWGIEIVATIVTVP